MLGDRAALGVGFFLFPLCAAALDVVSERVAAWGLPAARSLVPLLGIGLVFFVPGEVTPALRYRPDDALEVYARLPAEPAGRTFDVTRSSISLDGFYGESSVSPYWSARALPFGAYPQGAPLGSQVSLALAGKLAQELGAPAPFLSDDGADILYLLHVRFLVDRGEPPVFDALRIHRSVGASVRAGVLELHHASPALFAPQLARLPAELRRASGTGARPALLAWLEAQWEGDPLEDPRPDPSLNPLFRTGEKNDWTLPLALVRAMGIDREGARAAQLFVEDPLPEPAQASTAAAFAVLSQREDLDSVEVVAHASAPGFVRLSYAYDPELEVALDGQVAGVVPDALGGAIVLAFPAGTHTISLRPPGAGPRTALLGTSAVLSVGLAGLLVAAGRRRGRGPLDPA